MTSSHEVTEQRVSLYLMKRLRSESGVSALQISAKPADQGDGRVWSSGIEMACFYERNKKMKESMNR